jgi:probable phosphoglycerate mutase
VELVLIRHGLPLRVENPDGRPADPSLSDEGWSQARRLSEWLAGESFDALYARPLRRALETAAPLAEVQGRRVEVEPGVVELDHLSSQYVPLEEIKAADPQAWQALVTGGLYAEVDLPAFRRNVAETLERIIGAHRGGRVAVVCHGGVINSWAGHVLGVREPFFFFDPGYTSVHRFLAASSGERSVVSLNETAHLRPAGR